MLFSYFLLWIADIFFQLLFYFQLRFTTDSLQLSHFIILTAQTRKSSFRSFRRMLLDTHTILTFLQSHSLNWEKRWKHSFKCPNQVSLILSFIAIWISKEYVMVCKPDNLQETSWGNLIPAPLIYLNINEDEIRWLPYFPISGGFVWMFTLWFSILGLWRPTGIYLIYTGYIIKLPMYKKT